MNLPLKKTLVPSAGSADSELVLWLQARNPALLLTPSTVNTPGYSTMTSPEMDDDDLLQVCCFFRIGRSGIGFFSICCRTGSGTAALEEKGPLSLLEHEFCEDLKEIQSTGGKTLKSTGKKPKSILKNGTRTVW